MLTVSTAAFAKWQLLPSKVEGRVDTFCECECCKIPADPNAGLGYNGTDDIRHIDSARLS